MKPSLLSEDERLPSFTLQTSAGKAVRYDSLLRRRRIIVLTVSEDSAENRRWLAAARREAGEFAERDLTVLAIAEKPEEIAELRDLPEPFFALRDPDGGVSLKLGGVPAFYLIGKDTHTVLASRHPRAARDLFRLIDAMPMRREEMRKGRQ